MQQLREIVDRDYVGVIKGRLDEVYKSAGAATSNARPDRAERENRVTFIVSPCQFLDFLV
jgi:conserved oligomeric Golgi complex subunit 4